MEPNTEVAEDASKKAEIDKWAVKTLRSTGKTWGEMNPKERVLSVLMTIAKTLLVFLLLYMFIISLGLMGNAFKVIGGKSSGKTFRQSELFSNPVAGVCLGILATVLVQSSSTSTSVIITMTAAELITMKNSIPIIMGANIGTAVTASIVSLASVGDRDQYRRAFGGAIVHYCFNILTVVVLLPLEVCTGMIQALSSAIVDAAGITNDDEKGSKQDFLKVITKPVSSRLLQVDKKLVTMIAEAADAAELAELERRSMIAQSQSKDAHLFMDTPMSDSAAGVVLMIVSLLFLSVCLVLLVKTLQSVFKGRAAVWIGKLLNFEIRGVPLVADYVLMTFGMGLTILMQSSSVTTSTLTPLVGIGLIRVDKMFPFTIGANIGTTVTGILAALASSNMKIGFQVALAHLLFNVLGTLMWFAVPATRKVPLGMAMFLGDLAAEVKAFPVLLIVFAWMVLPGGLLLLSVPGVALVATIGGLLLVACAAVIVVLTMRAFMPGSLPARALANPRWLPPCMCTAAEAEQRRELWFQGDAAIAEEGGAEGASVDSRAGSWWQAPVAWGSGWFILMALATALPNCQWGILKYPKFDGRDHVGIGTWTVCSAMYEEEAGWAASKSACSAAYLLQCGNITGCLEGDFSSRAGANEAYEQSWLECRSNCTPAEWHGHCLSSQCSGSQHTSQCDNVTEAVHEKYEVSYKGSTSAGPAWAAGERCRDVSEICDNTGPLGVAGVFGWLGFAFAALGQGLLLANLSMKGPRRKLQMLVSSLVSFLGAWATLLVSWATFAAHLGAKTSCTIMDASATGAVLATGNFGDIILGSGSFSYAFVIGSWVLVSVVSLVIGHRAFVDVGQMRGRSEKGEGDVNPGEGQI